MFLDAFYADPMTYIGAAFALIGAFGVVMFVVGFLAGLPHLFTLSGHDGHLEHHRTRAMWGILILIHAFILWEIVRLVASWFGWQGTSVDPSIAVHLIVAYLLVGAVLWICFSLTGVIVDGDH